VAAICAPLHLDALELMDDTRDEKRIAAGHTTSQWVLVGRKGAVDRFKAVKEFKPLKPRSNDRPWTDDYSNVLSAMTIFRKRD
jgi:hypothetical protein